MGLKACKFGGSSVAEAAQIRKVEAIVRGDPERRYVVTSAPGKRSKDDQKITDLLYLCHEHARQGVKLDEVFQLVSSRYLQIASDLGLKRNLSPDLEAVRKGILDAANRGAGPDYAASRGEYLSALVLAEVLEFDFVDAADLVFFDADGRFDAERTQHAVAATLAKHRHAVIPGFYGAMPDGSIRTFSRGGSDISGAIIARGVDADIYENWTDVSGLLMTDPRVVESPRRIDVITYRELRELAYMGATVLHDEAIFPVRQAGIPVQIRNTNRPEDPGTIITRDLGDMPYTTAITGIAGRRNFSIIAIEKTLMNAEVGFARRLLSVLESNNISFEHMPSGIDTISVVIESRFLKDKLDRVLKEIQIECRPDSVEVFHDIALIATVGRGMMHTPGMAGRLFGALAGASVNVRMIDQGSGELNIIVGVKNEDFERAVRAIYDAFAAI